MPTTTTKPRKTKADRVLAGRLKNLSKANESRFAKAELKRDLARMDQVDGLVLIADRLERNPGLLRSFAVEELLTAIQGVGKVKAERMTKAVERRIAAIIGSPMGEPMPLSMRVRDLSEMRRHELAVVLRERAHDFS